MSDPNPTPVLADPNECLIRGRIVKIEPAVGGYGTVWSIQIEDSTDLPGARNFARHQVASVVPVLVHRGLKEAFEPGLIVEARVTYGGDERGGAFFLMGQDVRHISQN